MTNLVFVKLAGGLLAFLFLIMASISKNKKMMLMATVTAFMAAFIYFSAWMTTDHSYDSWGMVTWMAVGTLGVIALMKK